MPSNASTNAKRAGLVLAGIALIIPLWVVKYPPLIDYPNHLARAYVLHHLDDPGQIFSQWYTSDWGPNPYLVVDFLLQQLQNFFGIYTAGRLFLTLCVLAVPLSTWLFLRQASPNNEYLALWAFVVAYDINFLMGFLSFQLSMSLCLVVVAAWLAYLKSRAWWKWFLILLLVTALYFTHIGGFGVAAVVLLLYTWMQRRRFAEICQSVLLFVPGTAFFLYMETHSWAKRGLDYGSWHFSAKLVSLTAPFRGYSRTADLICLLVFAGCLLAALIRNREAQFNYVWLIIAAAIFTIHWVLPERYGDLASIDTRFSPFVFLFALAIPALGKRKDLMLYAALAVFAFKTVQITSRFREEQKKLEALSAGFTAIPEHAHVLACSKAPPPEDLWVRHSEYHFWAYGIIARGWVSPSLFHQAGVQPLLLKKAVYLGDGTDGGCLKNPSWDGQLLRREYDDVWAYDVPSLKPGLSEIASPAYNSDKLVIYEIRKAAVVAGN